jgi:hypothetical protein
MSDTLLELRACPHCGADCDAAKPRCWLCGGELTGEEIVDAVVVKEPPPYAPSDVFFAVASAVLAVVIVLVGIGAALTEPGLAIAMAVVVAPALLATVIRTQRVEARHGYVSWGERLATFIVSAAAVVGLLGALWIALLIALVALCFLAMAGGQF